MKNLRDYITEAETDSFPTKVGKAVGGAERTTKQTAADVAARADQAATDVATGYKAGLAGETPTGGQGTTAATAPTQTPATPNVKPDILVGGKNDPKPEGYNGWTVPGYDDAVFYTVPAISARRLQAAIDSVKDQGRDPTTAFQKVQSAPPPPEPETSSAGQGAKATADPADSSEIMVGKATQLTPAGYNRWGDPAEPDVVYFTKPNVSQLDLLTRLEKASEEGRTFPAAPDTTPAPTAPTTGKPDHGRIVQPSKPVSWKEIYDLNKATIGSNPNLIKPGQTLKMPDGSTYTVKSGDNLTKIAKAATSTQKPNTVVPNAGTGAKKAAPISPQVKANREAGNPDWYEPEDYARDQRIQDLLHPEKNQTKYQQGVAKEKDQLAQMAKLAGVKLPNLSTTAGPQGASANVGGRSVSAGPQGATSTGFNPNDINAAYNNWKPSAADYARAQQAAKEFQDSDGSNAEYEKISRALQASRPAYIPPPMDQSLANVAQAEQDYRARQGMQESNELADILKLAKLK